MPKVFFDDQIQELIERTEKGEPLTKICEDPRMPSRSAVYDWLDTQEDFSGRFRAARARGIHALAEECIEIADNKDEDPASRRVRIDTRLRLAGKWLPKEYGDKVQHEAELHHTVALDEGSLPAALAFLTQYSAAREGGPDAAFSSVG